MEAVALKKTETIRVGERTVLSDGTTIVAEKRKKEKSVARLQAGETEVHEAKHAVVAWKRGTKVLYITAISGEDGRGNKYLGMTVMASYDAAAAAAPHVHGHSGTSGDAALMAAHNHDINSDGNAAHGILAESEAYVIAVANALSENGSLSASAFDSIMQIVKDNEDDEFEVVIKIYPPEGGNPEERIVEIPEGEVVILADHRSDIKTEKDFAPSRKAA